MVRTRGGGRCFPPGRREQSSAVRGTNSNSLSVENDNEMHEESPIGVNATLGSLASPTRNEAIGSGAQQNQISGSRNPNRRRPRTQLRQNNPTLERGNDAHAQENEIEEELVPTNNIYPPSVTSIVPPFRTRQRGLNRGTPHPAEPGLRILISISGQSFKPSSVVQEISASVKYHITGPWPSWAHFPDHLKTCLWELFEAKYRWTFETIDDIKRVWWGIANRRYRDIICKERKKVELKVKSSKPLDWRGHGPKWLGENTWNKLCEDHWSTEKFQRMSDAGKNNRRSSADGTMSTHTGGSRPFAVHEEEMEDEYKRKVSKVELYDRTHRTKQGKGEFICDKAKRVRDAYDNLVEDNSLSTFNPDAWIEACGGVPKGRVYGFGSQPPHQILGDIAHSAEDPSNAVDDRIVRLSYLPCRVAKRYKGYFVNGFKFHTKEYGNSKSTMNSGVWVWGTSNENDMTDYYGMLEEIIELEYFGNENKVVLFKCHWYDTTSNNGIRVHPRLKLVEINQKSKLNTSDKFILAQQAQQVYYTDFPKHPIRHSRSRVRGELRAVCKIKARSRIDVPHLEEHDDNDQLIHEGPFQEMEDSISEPRTNMNFVEEDHDPLNPDFDLQEVNPKDLARPQAHLFDIAEEEEDDEEGAFENLFSNDEENLHENEDNEISDCDDEIDYDD
ncbi:hypothetical protein BUALT_Bualt08G0013800 [Buddleja alternifolia]|uniref:DUF4216 domain-containing protein n=1 Tax=Buddleja alternifolia TaxID=168488 RepID=A0AAV6X4I2_9LAMI|nr:hypothetical protein BUALT_Bualt08G0013800 [Buddleja alternifolia]